MSEGIAYSKILKATGWMVGAIVSFTSMAISGREINFAHDTFEIMLFRSLLGLLIMSAVLSAGSRWAEVRKANFKLNALRNVCHFIGQNLWFFAVPLITLAQLFALEFTTPIWVLLLSPLLLKERLTKMYVLTALLGFVGILMVAQPGTSPISFALMAGASCAIFFALTAIFTRKLTQDHSIACILFYLTAIQSVFGFVCVIYDGAIAWPTSETLPWLVIIGIAGLMAHFCLTNALALAPAMIIMPLDFVRLPVIAIIGMLFYSEPFSTLIIGGAVLIFAANYINISCSRAK